MNLKRSAAEPLLPLRAAKQPRTAFIRPDGDKASPTESEGLTSRWKGVAKLFWDLSKDTFTHFVPVKSPRTSLRRSKTPSTRSLRGSPPLQIHTRPRRNSSQTSSSSNQVQPFVPTTFNFSPLPPPSLNGGSIFKPSVSPLVTPSRKSRRPRARRSMHPPPTPPPKFSPKQFPTLPPSPAPSSLLSQTDSFKDGIPRNYRTRKHIFAEKHKRKLIEDRDKARQELINQLYEQHQKHGYRSDLATFEGFLSYRALLEKNQSKHHVLSPSSSLVDLRAPLGAVDDRRTRRHSTPELSTEFLKSALEKAKATLKEPKPPKPFAPTLEQLRLRELSKDDQIEQRLRPKRVPLPTSLPPKDEAAVDQFLRKNGIISSYARESVADKDIRRLAPNQWLNDEIINFYGAMLLGRAEAATGSGKENIGSGGGGGKKKPLNAYYFTSFFWSKLEKDGYEKGRLAKWTKKIDLFAKDVALIPVNHNNAHWTAAAINFKKKRIESYDSMSMHGREVCKTLRGYLDAEHRNKKKQPFDFTGWEDYTSDNTPQQENNFDCGIFTCQFLENLSRGEEEFNFTQEDIPYLRRRMIWEIGNAKFWTG